MKIKVEKTSVFHRHQGCVLSVHKTLWGDAIKLAKGHSQFQFPLQKLNQQLSTEKAPLKNTPESTSDPRDQIRPH